MSQVTQPINVRRVAVPVKTSAVPGLAFVPPVALVALLATAVASVLLFEVFYFGRIFPGVQMWGLDLGGMRPAEAALALEARFPYSSQPMITLSDGDRTWKLSPRDLGLEFDVRRGARSAYRLGRSGSLVGNLREQARLVWSGAQVGPVIRQDTTAARAYLEQVAASVNVSPRDASLRLDGLNAVATPVSHRAQAGCRRTFWPG